MSTPHWPGLDCTAALPDELLLLIFDFLRQPTLLCAARVSRRWRLAARSCSEFYRFIPLDVEDEQPDDAAGQLAEWVRVADECVTLGTPVGVEVDITGFPDAEDSSEPSAEVEIILQKISDLLGQTIHLSLMLPGVNAAAVIEALTSPAPVLRSLAIELDDADHQPLDDFQLPILAGFAPYLDTIRLDNVPLDYTQAHSAFHGVRNIKISPSAYPLLASLPETFPSAVTLEIDAMAYKTPSLPPASRPLYRLRSITVAAAVECIPPPIRDLIRWLPAISVHMRLRRKQLSWEEDIAPLVVSLPDPLELSITQRTLWKLSVRSAADARTARTLYALRPGTAIDRRMTCYSGNPPGRVPWMWPDLLPLLSRLSSLEIDTIALIHVAESLDVTLDALTSLTITFKPPSKIEAAMCWDDLRAWARHTSARGPLRCPGLTRLTLSWPVAYSPARAPRLVTQAVLLNVAKALRAPGPIELFLCGIRPLRVAAEPEHRASEDDAFNLVFCYAGDDWVDG